MLWCLLCLSVGLWQERGSCVLRLDAQPDLGQVKEESLWKIWLSVAVAEGAPGHSQAVTAAAWTHRVAASGGID